MVNKFPKQFLCISGLTECVCYLLLLFFFVLLVRFCCAHFYPINMLERNEWRKIKPHELCLEILVLDRSTSGGTHLCAVSHGRLFVMNSKFACNNLWFLSFGWELSAKKSVVATTLRIFLHTLQLRWCARLVQSTSNDHMIIMGVEAETFTTVILTDFRIEMILTKCIPMTRKARIRNHQRQLSICFAMNVLFHLPVYLTAFNRFSSHFFSL